MDGYPFHYVVHNLPFVVLFGLGSTAPGSRNALEEGYPLLQEQGIYISSDLPSVTGPAAEELLDCFHNFDAKDAAWNNRPGKGKLGTMGFTYRSVGRAFTLPPHKAKSQAVAPLPPETEEAPRRSSLTPVLHSALSPLSPESPTFPDGILTPFWFSKHQFLLPSTLIAFFNFTLDAKSSSLQDNKLKSEINALKIFIKSSQYKFRLLVVLVSEDNGSDTNTTDRLSNIRRGTSLDAKTLFFLSSGQSTVEKQAFVGTILASIQPSCIEYYRDLSKHARRKRHRGTIPLPTAPPTSGTSQTLSTQGWYIRYETKLGVFAEFRQEMDAAGRNYEAAYELLLDGDVLEGISSWSPRFDEARMLADVLAIRILRCLLWTGQTTSAVQSWSNHRSRILDLVERKGKGSRTYGWEAWDARWSAVMAELVEKVDVPIFQVPEQLPRSTSLPPDIPDIYAIPEKAFAAGELLPPWDLLHHEGYWFRRAAQHTRARRKLTLAMPKEDRSAPGDSPASQIANRAHLYDTYLCPEPHVEYALPGKPTFDHGALLIDTMHKAAGHFAKRGQSRAVERLKFEVAREHMRSGQWNDAMGILKPLWQHLSWRREGWWKLVEEISWAVRACARHLGDGETLVAVEWELLSSFLTPRPEWQHDISKCLDGLDVEDKPMTVIGFQSTAPCLSAIFAFGAAGGHVGDIIPTQLIVQSHAHRSSAPIALSDLTVSFEGGVKSISIEHDRSRQPAASTADHSVNLYDVDFAEPSLTVDVSLPRASVSKASQTLYASADLVFSPGTVKVFAMAVLPRVAGEVRAAQATLSMREEAFDLDVVIPLEKQPSRHDWWVQDGGDGLSRRKLDAELVHSINVLPKPPKLQIELPRLRPAYYPDEDIEVEIVIINAGEDEADVTIDVRLLNNTDQIPTIRWKPVPGETNILVGQEAEQSISDQTSRSQLTGSKLGRLPPSVSQSVFVAFQALPALAQHVIEIETHYRLLADPDTPMSKKVSQKLTFVHPFEATTNLAPLIHPDPWPSYFYDGDDETGAASTGVEPVARGLKQLWTITSALFSSAVERLIVDQFDLKVVEAHDSVSCRLLPGKNGDDVSSTLEMSPNDNHERTFDLEVHKRSLDDRSSAAITLQLEITWRRRDPTSVSSTSTTTYLSVPTLTIPFGEPRVLATAQPSTTMPFVIHLAYMIENPSVHLLTFALSMATSEGFAFSGPKVGTVQLVPLSRHQVRYSLLPTVRGGWIYPQLRVNDVGFNTLLKVGAAGGCLVDERGLAVWVDGESGGGVGEWSGGGNGGV